MKVFKFSKTNKSEFNSEYNKIKLYKKDKFNNIIISNPEKSNKIYIINSLLFNTEEKIDEIQIGILPFERNTNIEVEINNLHVACNNETDVRNNILIQSDFKNINYINQNLRSESKVNTVELLDENFLIVLPHGTFGLLLNKQVSMAEIEICLNEEII